MSDRIKPSLDENQIDRLGLPNGMAWTGTGAVWTVCGAALISPSFGQMPHHDATRGNSSFVQVGEPIAKSNTLGPALGFGGSSSFDYDCLRFVGLVVDPVLVPAVASL